MAMMIRGSPYAIAQKCYSTDLLNKFNRAILNMLFYKSVLYLNGRLRLKSVFMAILECHKN